MVMTLKKIKNLWLFTFYFEGLRKPLFRVLLKPTASYRVMGYERGKHDSRSPSSAPWTATLKIPLASAHHTSF